MKIVKNKNMDSEIIVGIVIGALQEITSPRFYRTERGFQGRFAGALQGMSDRIRIFPKGTIIEEEYQKVKTSHRVRLRPDLIIHIPFEAGVTESRKEGNFVVFAFKLRANEKEAGQDFEKIDRLFEKLNYPIGFFVNISGYPNMFLENHSGAFKDRIHELSNKMEDGKLYIRHGYFKNGKLAIEDVQ